MHGLLFFCPKQSVVAVVCLVFSTSGLNWKSLCLAQGPFGCSCYGNGAAAAGAEECVEVILNAGWCFGGGVGGGALLEVVCVGQCTDAETKALLVIFHFVVETRVKIPHQICHSSLQARPFLHVFGGGL